MGLQTGQVLSGKKQCSTSVKILVIKKSSSANNGGGANVLISKQ